MFPTVIRIDRRGARYVHPCGSIARAKLTEADLADVVRRPVVERHADHVDYACPLTTTINHEDAMRKPITAPAAHRTITLAQAWYTYRELSRLTKGVLSVDFFKLNKTRLTSTKRGTWDTAPVIVRADELLVSLLAERDFEATIAPSAAADPAADPADAPAAVPATPRDTSGDGQASAEPAPIEVPQTAEPASQAAPAPSPAADTLSAFLDELDAELGAERGPAPAPHLDVFDRLRLAMRAVDDARRTVEGAQAELVRLVNHAHAVMREIDEGVMKPAEAALGMTDLQAMESADRAAQD